MNPDDLDISTMTIGSVTLGNDGYSIVTPNGLAPISAIGNSYTTAVSNAITLPEDPLDQYAMNRFAVDHKVTAQELLKLQEVAPDYAKEIKENIAKNLARDIATKVSYTKKHDKDTDVHHFIGRVWVFSEEELKGILGIK